MDGTGMTLLQKLLQLCKKTAPSEDDTFDALCRTPMDAIKADRDKFEYVNYVINDRIFRFDYIYYNKPLFRKLYIPDPEYWMEFTKQSAAQELAGSGWTFDEIVNETDADLYKKTKAKQLKKRIQFVIGTALSIAMAYITIGFVTIINPDIGASIAFTANMISLWTWTVFRMVR